MIKRSEDEGISGIRTLSIIDDSGDEVTFAKRHEGGFYVDIKDPISVVISPSDLPDLITFLTGG